MHHFTMAENSNTPEKAWAEKGDTIYTEVPIIFPS